MRLENYAKEKLTGKFDIVLEPSETRKEQVELSVKLLERDEIDTILALDSYQEDKENSLKKQKEIVHRVLERSYPDLSKEEIEKIVVAMGNELLLEFCYIWGIRNKEAVKKVMELQMKKLDSLLEDDKEPKES